MDILLIILFVANLFLGAVVFLKGRSKLISGLFLAIAIGVALWNMATFLFWHTSNPLFWSRVMFIGPIIMGTTFLHLCLIFPPQTKSLKLIAKVLMYAVLTGFLFLVPTDIIVKKIIFPSREVIYGLGNALFGIYFCAFVFVGFMVLIKKYRMAQDLEKLQLKYLLLGTTIATSIGVTTNLFFPLLGTSRFNKLGPGYSFIFVLFTAYAILKYRLFDIEVLIKKTLVFAGLFTFAFGVIVGVAMITQELISHFFAISRFVSLGISAAIIIFSLRPLENFLVNITNKYLFQKKYEYKQILKAFIKEVITVLNLDEVVNSTLKLFDETIHPYAASVFILNKVEDKYQLYNSYGIEDKNLSFTSDSKLIILLKKTKAPAVIKQIDGIAGVNPEIAGEMAGLKAVIVLPLALHDDLIGFISLGKKKSDEEYTKDDMDVFLDLAGTESIAVGNAQLFQEAAQTERRAAIGTMAAGINHEIGNPVNIVNTKIQLFLTSIERGFYEQKSKEDIIRECRDILVETIKQTNRIADITRRLSNFAKPSKEFKPELISVANEIDEALFVVGHELELGRIKIKKDIPVDLYKILADRREIQQIFFNLIRNAAQAIEGTGTITIRGLSTTDGKMRIEIEDTGKGIPEDKIHRIFEPFFTTKGPNKGTGLGLSIVRQLVWRNKGEISFRSQAGTGTTFILEFPRATG